MAGNPSGGKMSLVKSKAAARQRQRSWDITKEQLVELVEDATLHERGGAVSSLIPGLRAIDETKVGISVHFIDPDRESVAYGDHQDYRPSPADDREPAVASNDASFTIQSVSKVFALLYVLEECGEKAVFRRVGKEPTGDPFDAEPRIKGVGELRMPYNPLINVGAILVTSMFPPETNHRLAFDKFLTFMQELCGAEKLEVDEEVFKSEQDAGYYNRALAWILDDQNLFQRRPRKKHINKEFGKGVAVSGDTEVSYVENILDNYFKQCSIRVTTDHLARAAAVIANGGRDPKTGEILRYPHPEGNGRRLIRAKNARTVMSLMSSCGMYDGSGEFAHDIGIPAKSGIGGGIMCVEPGKLGIATFAPRLDERGNSLIGLYMLKRLSQRHDLSLFRRTPKAFSPMRFTDSEALDQLAEEVRFQDLPARGCRKAFYIPELGVPSALTTGISICFKKADGQLEAFGGGDHKARFSLQSIGTLFALLYVLNHETESVVFSRVGKEPSGESFNRVKWKNLEARALFSDVSETKQLAFYPMINAGALVLSAIIPSRWELGPPVDALDGTEPRRLVGMDGFMAFVRELCGNPDIEINWEIFKSERKTAFTNWSLAWRMNDKRIFDGLLKGHDGAIDSSTVEEILSVYFRICSIQVTCDDLAHFASVMAHGGADIRTGRRFISRRYVTIATAMMASSGLFDGSGEFAYRVGIPAKRPL